MVDLVRLLTNIAIVVLVAARGTLFSIYKSDHYFPPQFSVVLAVLAVGLKRIG